MNHTNAITDILRDFMLVVSGMVVTTERNQFERTKQALYEAVKGCVPKEVRYNDETVPKYLKPAIGENWQQALRHEQGFNDCRNEVLTNLSLLFGVDGGLEKPKDSSEPVTTKSVTLVSAYEPITAHDQHGNPYICLNQYEARSIAELLGKLDAQGHTRYNTGDWWIDLPTKIIKWLRHLDTGNDLGLKGLSGYTDVSNPPNPAGISKEGDKR